MVELISVLLGKYTYNAYLFASNFLQTELCAVLCSWSRKRRKGFALRLTVCTAAGLLLCVPVAMLNTEAATAAELPIRVFCYLLV